MNHVLTKRSRHVLIDFALSNVLLAFDFDGTLAPIAYRPEQVRMRSRTRRLLAALSARYPLVIISGRSRPDLARLVRSVPVWHLAGNHGIEPWDERSNYAAKVQQWKADLSCVLAGYRGVVVEDKTYSLTVHYRRARPKLVAKRAVQEAVRRLRGARALAGKDAISLLPAGALQKGTALDRARRLLACDCAIYVGDDETDEDAFGGQVDRLLAVRVGRNLSSRARYCLSTQREVDDLLQLLVTLRPTRHHRR